MLNSSVDMLSKIFKSSQENKMKQLKLVLVLGNRVKIAVVSGTATDLYVSEITVIAGSTIQGIILKVLSTSVR